MGNKFGWHSGSLTCKNITVQNDFTVQGNLTFGDASTDTLSVNGAATFSNTLTVGVDDTGYDVKFFGATASAYLLWDESADALLLSGDARIDLSACTVKAANTDGGVIKVGTSGSPVTEDTANMKFMAFYFDNGATSGDNRGMYLRQYLTGAGGGGDAMRVFSTVSDVAASTVHGAHISLSLGSTGSVTGLGVAVRGTVHVPNALSGGTYAALQAEIYGDGASADVSGATEFSFLRLVADGATADVKATVDTAGYLFSLHGLTVGSGKLFQANTAAAASHALRINIGGTDYFIMLTDTGA